MTGVRVSMVMAGLLVALSVRGALGDAKPIAIAKVEHAAAVDFEKEILPVLRSNCLACHNRTKAKAELVLETPADILKGGQSGPAVVPGKGELSLLIKAAAHLDDPTMPPKDNKVQAVDLTPEQLGLIRLWIDQGAKGEVHASETVQWRALPENFEPIYAVALTADGQWAACGRGNRIFVYHVPSKRPAAELVDGQLKEVKGGAAHRDLVQSLAISPDGMVLASGGYREVKIWRRAMYRESAKVETGSAITAVAASADGKRVAIGLADGAIKLLDSSGKSVADWAAGGAAVTSLRFSPDGARLAVTSANKSARVVGADGKDVGKVEIPADASAVAWASAKQIAVGGGDGVLRLYAVPEAAGELTAGKELKGHEGAVTALAADASKEGQIVSGGADGTVRVWDVNSDKPVRQMKHGAAVGAVAVRNDGKRIVSAGADNAARLWDGEAKAVAELKGDRYANERVAEAARAVVLADAEVAYRKNAVTEAEKQAKAGEDRLKKAKEGVPAAEKAVAEKQKAAEAAAEAAGKAEKEKQAEDKIKAAKKAKDDAEKAVEQAKKAKGSADDEVVFATKGSERLAGLLSEAKAAAEVATTDQGKRKADVEAAKKGASEAEKPVKAVAFSPDGLTVASAGDDQLVHTWGAETGAAFETVRGHSAAVTGVAFVDARHVVAASEREARAWDLSPGWALERTLGSPDVAGTELGAVVSDRVYALDFSPDGARLAAGSGVPSRAGEIRVWHVGDGKLVGRFDDVHSDTVFAVRFSPDGKSLASSAADRFVRVIDLEQKKVVRSYEGHTHHVLGVAWKRDGRVLASAGADNVVKTWDFVTGERRKNVVGPTKEVTAVQFVGVTEQVLSASGDGKVRFVKEDGSEARAFAGFADFVYGVAASADGSVVVAGGQDGVLRVWNGNDAKVVAEFGAGGGK